MAEALVPFPPFAEVDGVLNVRLLSWLNWSSPAQTQGPFVDLTVESGRFASASCVRSASVLRVTVFVVLEVLQAFLRVPSGPRDEQTGLSRQL